MVAGEGTKGDTNRRKYFSSWSVSSSTTVMIHITVTAIFYIRCYELFLSSQNFDNTILNNLRYIPGVSATGIHKLNNNRIDILVISNNTRVSGQ